MKSMKYSQISPALVPGLWPETLSHPRTLPCGPGVVPSPQGVFGVSREVQGSTLPLGNSGTRTWGEEHRS